MQKYFLKHLEQIKTICLHRDVKDWMQEAIEQTQLGRDNSEARGGVLRGERV